MLLQLENTNQEDVNKLLAYAQQNHLKLSLIDNTNQHHLPGKPLTEDQLTSLIESSRKSGMITMHQAHQNIRNSYNGY